MTIRRSAAAVGAVALGLFALSACTKPTPLATVTVGEKSVHSQAACYNDGKALAKADLQKCLTADGGQELTIGAAENLHIGVEPAIANKGWFLVVNQQETPVIKDTYRTFNGSSLFQDSQTGQTSTKPAVVNVVETADGTQNTVVGVWQFKLDPKS
ncbi:hypothetical protein POF50_009645 [Streptomyces sp. SL13]|uniref:DUF2771 domain-containing protein n=1 Tax=Streptantibioticus silvisoli TaxID=2705255 RepID=A0AA90KG18_9ACTN|nr:hypothetical protein [Streptantibioticus silvisoli]MDI5965188.1 hypothetical protein [Streptantibioticus silvisoli]MDI5969599.1 hypothetical protein [Streptantibioticus silvisoli]